MAEIRRPLIVDAGRRRRLAASEVLPGASIDQIAGLAPTLDLDFERQVYRHYSPSTGLRSKLLSDIVTFTRASSATYFDAKGVMQTAGSNEPRIDFDPLTGVCRGLLIEEARTNLFLNSLLDGTNLATQTVTVTAAAHTISFYGTGSITLSGAHSATITGTSDTARTSLTFTPTAGSLVCTVSGAVKWANCELGSFATSHIPTSGTAATRAADVAVISGTAFSDFYRQGVGTLYSAVPAFSYEGNHVFILASLTKFDGNNLVQLHRSYVEPFNRFTAFIRAGGVAQTYFNPANFAAGVAAKMGVAFAQDNSAFSYNTNLLEGNTVSTPEVDRLFIGANFWGATFSRGHIARLAYWPSRLPNATLQQLTAG